MRAAAEHNAQLIAQYEQQIQVSGHFRLKATFGQQSLPVRSYFWDNEQLLRLVAHDSEGNVWLVDSVFR